MLPALNSSLFFKSMVIHTEQTFKFRCFIISILICSVKASPTVHPSNVHITHTVAPQSYLLIFTLIWLESLWLALFDLRVSFTVNLECWHRWTGWQEVDTTDLDTWSQPACSVSFTITHMPVRPKQEDPTDPSTGTKVCLQFQFIVKGGSWKRTRVRYSISLPSDITDSLSEVFHLQTVSYQVDCLHNQMPYIF